jgi:hypothetical protein
MPVTAMPASPPSSPLIAVDTLADARGLPRGSVVVRIVAPARPALSRPPASGARVTPPSSTRHIPARAERHDELDTLEGELR